MKVSPISWQTQIVDPETGRPTQAFIDIWNTVFRLGLASLSDVDIISPSNGDTISYDAASKKWVAS